MHPQKNHHPDPDKQAISLRCKSSLDGVVACADLKDAAKCQVKEVNHCIKNDSNADGIKIKAFREY